MSQYSQSEPFRKKYCFSIKSLCWKCLILEMYFWQGTFDGILYAALWIYECNSIILSFKTRPTSKHWTLNIWKERVLHAKLDFNREISVSYNLVSTFFFCDLGKKPLKETICDPSLPEISPGPSPRPVNPQQSSSYLPKIR